jgi:hypothetical protein
VLVHQVLVVTEEQAVLMVELEVEEQLVVIVRHHQRLAEMVQQEHQN